LPSELVKNTEQELGEVNNDNSKHSQLSGVQRLLETGLLFFSVFAMFIMLALFSFDPADPGWAQTGYQTPIRNLGGAVGAYLSDLLLNLFGFIAYSLPFIIAIIGWLLFQKFHQLMQLDYLTLALKLIGFIMFYLGITSLASMNFDDLFYFSAGGILGDVLSETLLPYFSFVGTTLVSVMFTCAGFVLLTGFSWLNFIDNVGKYTIATVLFIQQLPRYLLDKFNSRDTKVSDDSVKKIIEEDKKVTAEPSPIKSAKKNKLAIPFLDSKSENSSEMKEHFIDINDLMDGPLEIKVQEHVSDAEISAAFADVEKVDVADDNVFVDNKPSGELVSSTDDNQINLVPAVEEKFVGMPSIDLLDRPDKAQNPINRDELEQVSRLVEARLLDFKVHAQVFAVYPGPVITRFELDLAPGMKVSKISALSKDLARALSAISVRVVEVIPGKSVIGLELPNKHREIVHLSEVISCTAFEESKSPLAMVLGKDIAGEPVVVDLAKMPHLLVAGTTGSGKSVGVNTMIVSLLYKSTPEDVRLIMIDPKMLELSVYEGIPHLLAEVVTDMKDAANALRWCVGEMERRYKLMSALGVRNLKGYNKKVLSAIDDGEPLIDPIWQPSDGLDQTPPMLEKLPSIVVVVDEFADMMMIVGKKVEELIARIAQKARAAGIHLLLATQRPSVDVITGLIKANVPTRIAFQVSSKIDSRTILDQGGAEQLLGHGDMLYLPPGTSMPIRVHGAFVDDHEVHKVVHDWKRRGKPDYIDGIVDESTNLIPVPGLSSESEDSDNESDVLYDEAVEFVTQTRKASISSVQRKLRIGYNRAARLIETMEAAGVITEAGHNGSREVIAPAPPER
jgi:S-DNA-T family DNA segregation ATPase FtsK/SpoIIIE